MKPTDREPIGRGKRISVVLLASSLLFGACSSGDDAEREEPVAAEETSIDIDTFVYRPQSVTVPVGTTIRWTNGDDILHTVTSGKQTRQGVPGVTEDKSARPDGAFDLELDGEGSSNSFTFDEAGTYRYFCRVHAAMTGRVVVE